MLFCLSVTHRMQVLLGALALGGCSWSGPITRMGPAPDPAGPCLQIVHPRRHVWQFYKGSQLVGRNDYDSFLKAVADRPRSVLLLKRSQALNQASTILAAGVALGVGFVFAGALTNGRAQETLIGSGAAIGLSSFVTSVTLGNIADQMTGKAITEYNTAARPQGCSALDAGVAVQASGG